MLARSPRARYHHIATDRPRRIGYDHLYETWLKIKAEDAAGLAMGEGKLLEEVMDAFARGAQARFDASTRA